MSRTTPEATPPGQPLHQHATSGTPHDRAPARVMYGMALAQFALFIALLAPVTVSLAIKAQTIVPAEQAAATTGFVLSVAAIVALVANPLFGRLSDVTMSRFGRRRPWMFAGAVVFVIALAIVALATTPVMLLLGWCLAQLAGNAILAPLLATIADQVPQEQRGTASANVGVMQNLGILAAAFVANWFVSDMVLLFVVPALFALAMVIVYCFLLPDRPLAQRPVLGGWKATIMTFWVNPIKHPDFAWVWISRFLLTLAAFLFITFRLFFLQKEIGLSIEEAIATLTTGVLIYTIALAIFAKIGGWLSDRVGYRKIFVIVSTIIFAIGTILLSTTETIPSFYVIEAIMGAAYGVYVAVDTALVIDVLPDPEQSAKDLGVLNIANALPQSLAGAVGALLLSIGGGSENYAALFWAAGIFGILGALTILPVRSVK